MQNLTQAQRSQAAYSEANNLPQNKIDEIFARLIAAFGYKFKSLFKSSDELRIAQVVWSRRLAPIPFEMIDMAMDKVESLSEWNPCTAEFIRIAFELPSLKQCKGRILSGKASDAVSIQVKSKITNFDDKNEFQLAKEIEFHFDDVYETVLSELFENPYGRNDLQIEDDCSGLGNRERREMDVLKLRAKHAGYDIDTSLSVSQIRDEIEEREFYRDYGEANA